MLGDHGNEWYNNVKDEKYIEKEREGEMVTRSYFCFFILMIVRIDTYTEVELFWYRSNYMTYVEWH